jgi:cytochrome oxidase Cu insertion factor (SCO1/SenC/PrrC family)
MQENKLFVLVLLIGIQTFSVQSGIIKKKNLDTPHHNLVITVIKANMNEKNDFATEIHVSPVEIVSSPREWKTVRAEIRNGKAYWNIPSGEAVYFAISPLPGNMKSKYYVGEPGDSIEIKLTEQGLQYTGKGSEKLRLRNEIDSILARIPKPSNRSDMSTETLEDYFEWNNYLNKQLELINQVTDSYKGKISEFAYNYIKARLVDQNIDDRSDKFGSFVWGYAIKSQLSKRSISDIYDSTYFPSTQESFKFAATHVYGTWKPLLFQILRKYEFNSKISPLDTELKRKLLYYKSAISFYKDIVREKFIIDFLTEDLVREHGFIPEIEKLLDDYLAEPDYPQYKEYVKNYVLNERDRLNEKMASDFTLINVNGNAFTKADIRGKIAVFDFWFTGCAGCIQMTPAMKDIEEEFKNDTNVVFLSVSVDKNKQQWLKSIKEGKYTTGTGINLYTGTEGSNHSMIRKYGISGYPNLCLIDPGGRLIRVYPRPDPRKDNGKNLKTIIRQQLTRLKDGPYVIHSKSDSSEICYLNGNALSVSEYERSNIPVLQVQTDKHKETFTLKLKDELQIEHSEYETPEKLFVLSDLEGNFTAFRELLQANNIIDENYNWVFGKGHLIFAGDMFDRGFQVTECLWLIYSLEEKAKAHGGHVHFILGNHEIMNLLGDHRYAKPKYVEQIAITGKTLKNLYSTNTELGRWLRTKNIMEKIGDILFVHGGVGKEFSDSVTLSISRLNALARKCLHNIKPSSDEENHARLLFSGDFSPFWFRQYYDNKDKAMWLKSDHSVTFTIEHPDNEEMNKILNRWNVRQIVTGHTVVADTISVHYDGRVINTDTRHAEGKSEALLIEGKDFFRVNTSGEKIKLLFTLPKK